MRKCVGTKNAILIVPDSAKLLADLDKRQQLLDAYEQFVAAAQKEKEEKKKKKQDQQQQQAMFGNSSSSPASSSSSPAAPPSDASPARPKRGGGGLKAIKVEDIEPVVGEAAQQLHKSILEAVQQAFGGDTKKMKTFTSNARKYGSEQLSAREFYAYLTASFELDFVGRLVPDLARLLQDADKRHALIRALCESAPGWAKFSGL